MTGLRPCFVGLSSFCQLKQVVKNRRRGSYWRDAAKSAMILRCLCCFTYGSCFHFFFKDPWQRGENCASKSSFVISVESYPFPEMLHYWMFIQFAYSFD